MHLRDAAPQAGSVWQLVDETWKAVLHFARCSTVEKCLPSQYVARVGKL